MSFTESLAKIIEENRNQLVGKHATWERVRLADVATILNGFPFESRRFGANSENGHPLIRIRDVLRSKSDTYYEGEFDPTYLVHRGDLLVGMDGDFNSAIWRGDSGLLNQRVCKVDLYSPHFEKRFLTYCLPGYLSAINAVTSSLTVKHLSSLTVADIPLPFPPLGEQSRIADAVDELLSDLDAGVAALERVRDKLKLYRAAVLKAAVEGVLTAEWRKQHPHTEPASDLLKRILAERRRRWEEEQLRKFKEKGREPPTNWKSKYKEPDAPNTTDLPPLPEGWCWANTEQVCDFITKGTTPPGKDAPQATGEVPFVKVQHLSATGAFWFFASPSFVARAIHEGFLARSKAFPGDVLMNIVGPPLGQVAVIPTEFPDWNVNQAIAIFRPLPGFSNRFLASTLVAKPVLERALRRTKTTAGQVNLTLEVCRDLAIPLPPRGEQEEIAEGVEQQLSTIDHLESDLAAKLTSAQALRQSILRHAFSGKLVPQDPKDEPASELLKRIAAEREQRAREAAAAKRPNGHKPRRFSKPRGKAARSATKETDDGRIADR